MSQQDYTMSLMRILSSVSLGDPGPVPTQGLRSRSLDSSQRSLHSCLIHNITSMNRGDTLKKKGAKTYSTTSEEVYPVREKAENQNKLHNKMDVRHVKEIKKLGVITSYALNKSCNQSQCSALQQRLNQHKNEHHRHHTRTRSFKKMRDYAVNVTPTISALHLSKCMMPLNCVQSIQTDITLQDVVIQKDVLPKTLSSTKGVPLKKCETRDIEPSYNFYKEYLQNVIMSWLLKAPIFYSTEFTTKHLKDNIVSMLVDKIDRMKTQTNSKQYEEHLQLEIDNCLNMLPMWLPNSLSDQTLFKNALRNKLSDKIKHLNEKFLGVQNEKENTESKYRSYTKINEIELEQENNELIMKEIHVWLAGIKFTRPVSRQHIIDLIMKKISPLLKACIHTRSYKLMLKGEIVDVLDELPINLVNTKNRKLLLTKYAEFLTNKLLGVQIKLDELAKRHNTSSRELVVQQCVSRVIGVPIYNSRIRLTVYDKVNKALGNVNINGKTDVIQEICDAILNSLETLRSGVEININNEITGILRRTNTITEERAKSIAKKIKLYVKLALKQEKDLKRSKPSYQCIKPQLSGVLSIYTSNSSNPVTSTPKKPTKKHISKLNPEEKSYMNKVAALISEWIETLPKSFNDDKKYKETIVNDLAGDIMDEVKREQLSPDTNTEKEKHLNYFMYRWLMRFDLFENLNDAKPLIEDFLAKLKKIPEPTLTASQHGTRQAMNFLKCLEQEFNYEEEFVPTGIDVLQDQISVWMNEQPSEIYAHDNKKKRTKMVRDLALTLQDRLRNKCPEKEIENDINQWLNEVVQSKEKEHIGLLTQNLIEKIIHVPQDATLEARHEKRKRQRAEYRINEPSTVTPEPYNEKSILEDPDKTMKEFILKYIERNYNIDDPLAQEAFAQLLKIELRKLSSPTRKDMYDNIAIDASHEKFESEHLKEVLEYVKIISDWLSNIPIQPLYNRIGHISRIEFVNDLARNIQEAEDQRKEYPNDMDYDNYISSIISRSLHTYNVPILPEHKDNKPMMVNQLLSKIISNRSTVGQNNTAISDIKEQNLSEFIEEYIRENGREIADDELILGAWTNRLQEVVKRMVHEGTDPSTLCKGKLYEQFAKVPIPGKDSVRRFSLEISYVNTISDWLKNLPLLPMKTVPKAHEERNQMVTNLAQKIAERKEKKNANEMDSADEELVQYITNWISLLPLDPRKSIVIPIVVQQLMNEIDKDDRNNVRNTAVTNDPGAQIVEFIEKWCNKLPIQGNTDSEVNIIKSDIAKKLYQKIGELNVDPRVSNDNIIFKNLLEDEIDTQFENLLQDAELQTQRESLKSELLNTILEMKKIKDQLFIGNNYRHQLETTIDAAMPDPIHSRQIIEPGFEIYKNHLANMFILDNFDHSNEDVKVKYENKIRHKIDEYFESAQNKNALPVTRDELFNEIYSELFKVPMPDKEAVINEVEEVKTRCEIEAWFEKLPLKEPEGIIELLEWDQIVSTLAKRIHEIEKNESIPDENIKKEIIKWLVKLPLLPGQEHNINQFTDHLQRALKDSKEDRKYVATESKKGSKGKAIMRISPYTRQVTDPNRESGTWVNPPPSAVALNAAANKSGHAVTQTPKKKSGDLIIDVVEDWCNQLPIVGDPAQNKIIKNNISTSIVMKIWELNMDSDIFNDDIIYDQLLDEGLENIMPDLDGCCDLKKSKAARKYQLKEMIKSIKPLIKEEKKGHEYKAELSNTVVSILNDHEDTNAKMLEFEKLKDDIVDYFVEFNYNRSDNDAKQIYKAKIHEAVVNYVTTIQNKDEQVDPLVRRNQLLCELSKIPIPNNVVLKEEVEKIRMKNELEQFFMKNFLDDNTEETAQMKKTLSKRLNDIEKLGHSESNDRKMVTEITKCLNKINKNVSGRVIEDFVNNLKNNEAERKAVPLTAPSNKDDVYRRESDILSSRFKRFGTTAFSSQVVVSCPGCQQTIVVSPTGFQQSACNQQVPQIDLSHSLSGQQWVSLEPVTPPANQSTKYHEPYITEGIRPQPDAVWNPTSANQSHYQTVNYEDFRAGSFLNSSLLPKGYAHSANLKQSSAIPAERTISEQESDVCTQTGNQDIQQNMYPEAFIQLPGGNADQNSENRYYDSSLQLSFSTPRQANLSQGQLLNFDNFKPLFSSSVLSQRYLGDAIDTGRMSPYLPSRNQRSTYEIPVNGQFATPRTVQQEALPFEPSLTQVTPESLFQAPNFVPRRLFSPLTVPRGDAEDRPTSDRSRPNLNGWREPVQSSENARYRCRCDKKLKKCDSGPYCMIPMDEFCEECGGFSPMWCKMPLPACFYWH